MSAAMTLRRLGEAMYGEMFQARLGRELNVNARQIRRWLAGEYNPPSGVWKDLLALSQDHQRLLARVTNEARKFAE